MKKKIEKSAWEKLTDAIKALYKPDGDNYVLDLEDDDSNDGDSDKLRIERQHRRAAEKKAKEAQDKLDELEDEKNKKNNDVAAVEASWKKKYDTLEAAGKAADEKHKSFVRKLLVDNVAGDLANELSKTAPKVLMPHLRSRLDVDFEGDEPRTIILGADGKRSASTKEELAKEFRDNKDFSSIITVSQASGGGAAKVGGTNGNGGALPAGTDRSQQQPTPLANLKANDLAAAIRAGGGAGRRSATA